MSDIGSVGKTLVVMGSVIILLGAVLMLGSKMSWFGRLPGDIYIQKKNFTFFFPVMTSIIVSLVISAVLILLRKR